MLTNTSACVLEFFHFIILYFDFTFSTKYTKHNERFSSSIYLYVDTSIHIHRYLYMLMYIYICAIFCLFGVTKSFLVLYFMHPSKAHTSACGVKENKKESKINRATIQLNQHNKKYVFFMHHYVRNDAKAINV